MGSGSPSGGLGGSLGPEAPTHHSPPPQSSPVSAGSSIHSRAAHQPTGPSDAPREQAPVGSRPLTLLVGALIRPAIYGLVGCALHGDRGIDHMDVMWRAPLKTVLHGGPGCHCNSTARKC